MTRAGVGDLGHRLNEQVCGRGSIERQCPPGTVHEIESAGKTLSRTELTNFRDWFPGFDADAWDRQF